MNKNIDDIFREQIQGHEYPFNEEYWEPMNAQLSNVEKLTSSTSSIWSSWLTYSIIGALSLSIGIGGFLTYKHGNQSSTEVVSSTEITHDQNQSKNNISTAIPTLVTVNENAEKTKVVKSKKRRIQTHSTPVEVTIEQSSIKTNHIQNEESAPQNRQLSTLDTEYTNIEIVTNKIDSSKVINTEPKKDIVPIPKPNKTVFKKNRWFSNWFKK